MDLLNLWKVGRTTKRDNLLVDDDYDIVFTFKKALEEYSQFEVDTFTDPIQALSRFKETRMISW